MADSVRQEPQGGDPGDAMSVDAEARDEEHTDEPSDAGDGRPPRGPLALTARGRKVALAVGGALLVGVVVAVVALAGGGTGGGSSAPPAENAAKLVPANALV